MQQNNNAAVRLVIRNSLVKDVSAGESLYTATSSFASRGQTISISCGFPASIATILIIQGDKVYHRYHHKLRHLYSNSTVDC